MLPAGNEKITDAEFNEIKNEMSTQKIVGMAPYRYETTKINQQPYILTGTDMIEVKRTVHSGILKVNGLQMMMEIM